MNPFDTYFLEREAKRRMQEIQQWTERERLVRQAHAGKPSLPDRAWNWLACKLLPNAAVYDFCREHFDRKTRGHARVARPVGELRPACDDCATGAIDGSPLVV